MTFWVSRKRGVRPLASRRLNLDDVPWNRTICPFFSFSCSFVIAGLVFRQKYPVVQLHCKHNSKRSAGPRRKDDPQVAMNNDGDCDHVKRSHDIAGTERSYDLVADDVLLLNAF